MKKIYISLLTFCISLTSCNQFLDVQPTGTIEEDLMFKDIQGYYDAMYGLYAKMGSKELYGENLSYGFSDNLGQLFVYNNTENTEYHIASFRYEEPRVKDVIEEIWSKQYEAILYLNNIIEKAENSEFSHEDLKLILGEAYGLRAFLHFDLVRLFAESYTLNKDARGIPYSFSFDKNNKSVFKVAEVYNHIIADLEKAEEYLKNDVRVAYDDGHIEYDRGRTAHFNKYAVMATKAMAYYSMGNYKKATEYATKVVESDNFRLTDPTLFADVKRYSDNKELIFGLHSRNFWQNVFDRFLTSVSVVGGGSITEARKDLEELFETSTFDSQNTDVRFGEYYKKEQNIYKFIRFISKAEEIKLLRDIQGITIIRLPEVYYILAESLYETNKIKAVGYLNMVRNSRGLTNIADEKVATKELFEQELIRERMRELAGEGKVFYYYKFYNKPFKSIFRGTVVEPDNNVFVLPWPDKEIEFGNK